MSFLSKYSDACAWVFAAFSVLLVIGIFYLQCRFEDLYRYAESIRRDGLIDSAFNTTLADISSESYYDTEGIEIGLRKILANIHENSFFSSKIIESMFKKEERKTIIAFLVLITTAVASSVTSQTFLAVLQVFLSMSFLGSYLKLRKLKTELDTVQTRCKAIWENLKKDSRKRISLTQQAQVIREIIRYETALAYAATLLDGDLFDKINPSTTVEWEAMRNRYSM